MSAAEKYAHPIEPDAGGEPAANDSQPAVAWPAPLDLAELARHEPKPPEFIIRDWLPCGYATLLAGHGGAGKSSISLEALVCIALGQPWCGLQTAQRPVVLLSCEDRADVLHWRLYRICTRLGVDIADLADRLHVLDLVGHDTILWTPDQERQRPAFAELQRHLGGEPFPGVLAVDGISDTFAGNENARAEVKAYINALLSLICPESGAVLLLGHVNKPSANTAAAEGYSGSTQWHNAARARWYLYPETEKDDDDGRAKPTGELILELQKSNLGKSDQEIRFAWDDASATFLGRLPQGGSDKVDQIQEQTERQSIIDAIAASWANDVWVPAARQGRTNTHTTLQATKLLNNRVASGSAAKKRFWRRLDELRQMGAIEEVEIRRTGRKWTAALQAKSQG